MIELLLVSTKTNKSKGGIAVWTDLFLEHCTNFNINSTLLNIATIGKRANQGNAKRNLFDEFLRTKQIFVNLKNLLKKNQFDICHFNTSCGRFGLIRDFLIIKFIRKKQSNCKILLHFHCDINYQSKKHFNKFVLKRILSSSDCIVVLNSINQLYLRHTWKKESFLLPNFIDEIKTGPIKINKTINKALYVGYVRREKGIKEIYELAYLYPNIIFTLVGEIHNEVLSWKKPNNVILKGKKSRQEIFIELENSDVFVFLSHSEGFSLALLEAMSKGLPCIATDVGANREMLEDLGGIIVPVGDIASMGKALKTLEDIEQRSLMSVWNINKVSNCYSIYNFFEKLNLLYDKIISDSCV